MSSILSQVVAFLAEKEDINPIVQENGSGDIEKRIRYGIFDDWLVHFTALHGDPQLESWLADQCSDFEPFLLTGMCVASILSNATSFRKLLEKSDSKTITRPRDLSCIREKLGVIQGTQDTALHLAATYSTKKEFERILTTLTRASAGLVELWDVFDIDYNRGYLLRLQNGNGETVLHRAAAMSNLGVVSYICEQAPEVACQVDSNNRSTLWHAACGGNDRIIHVVEKAVRSLKWAPPIDYPDDNGLTPLHVACREGLENCVTALLDLGASPLCAAQSSGLTPIHYASLFGHSDCLSAMAKHPDARSGFVQAVGMADADLIRPIHLAAANGWHECVRLLIKHGSPLSPLASVMCIVRESPSCLAPTPIERSSSYLLGEVEVQVQDIELSTPRGVAAKRGWNVVVSILDIEEGLKQHRDLARRTMPVTTSTLTNTGLIRTRRAVDLLELLHNN